MSLLNTYLGVMCFSTYENLAVFVLMLSSFRFPLNRYYLKITLSSLTLSALYLVIKQTSPELDNLFPIIQLLLIIFFLVFSFKVKVGWSLIMAVGVTIAYALLQIVCQLIYHAAGVFSLSDIQANPLLGYLLQFTSATIAFVISYFFRRYGYGFTYISVSQGVNIKNKLNISFIVLSIISMFMAGIVLGLARMGTGILCIGVILFAFSLALLIYLSLRKEVENEIKYSKIIRKNRNNDKTG